jgi:hypothetical protein
MREIVGDQIARYAASQESRLALPETRLEKYGCVIIQKTSSGPELDISLHPITRHFSFTASKIPHTDNMVRRKIKST